MIKPESRAFIVLLGALTMVNSVTIDMILPALPALGLALAASPDQVQLTLSLYILGFAAGQLVSGPLSDRFGRRRILLAGLSLYTVTALACAASSSIETLVAARTLQGFATAAAPVVGRAVVRDHFGGARAAQMLSSLTMVFTIGPLLAPFLGGVLVVHSGWRSVFLALALLAAILLAVSWRALGESLERPLLDALHLPQLVANYRSFLANPTCLGFALVYGMSWTGTFVYISGSPFVFIEVFGVPPENFGYYFGVSAFTILLGAYLNKRLLRRWPMDRVMWLGFGPLILGGILTLLGCAGPWQGAFLVAGGFAVYIFGAAFVQPNAVAGALEPVKHMAGTASAVIGFIQMLCGSLGGYAVNRFYDGTPMPMGALILLTSIATLGLYLLMVRARRPARAGAGGAGT